MRPVFAAFALLLIAAREVGDLGGGRVALVDGATDSFPAPFSALPPGHYRFQAVLDRNHDDNYGGRGAGDLVLDVIDVTLPGSIPTIVLQRALPFPRETDLLATLDEPERARAIPMTLPMSSSTTGRR